MVEEMIALRNKLDEKGIEWTDESQKFEFCLGGKLGIDRTHFNYKGKKISVINGYGTYGGLGILSDENEGLLELYDFESEPIGYLTADEVMKELEKRDES